MSPAAREYQFHDCARIFPLTEGEEQEALEISIQEHGIREPLVLLEGKILDGRNRYRVARKIGLKRDTIPTRLFDPTAEGDPWDFVWDKNVNRRHLNEIQRGLAAAEMETLRHGGRRRSRQHAVFAPKSATRTVLA
jgi:hypothetical protein